MAAPVEPPPPDARLFSPDSGNLLVRAPPGLPPTALSPPTPGNTVPLAGGISGAVEFETELFKGRLKGGGGAGGGQVAAAARSWPLGLCLLGGGARQ